VVVRTIGGGSKSTKLGGVPSAEAKVVESFVAPEQDREVLPFPIAARQHRQPILLLLLLGLLLLLYLLLVHLLLKPASR
jgi:hypothetical protein